MKLCYFFGTKAVLGIRIRSAPDPEFSPPNPDPNLFARSGKFTTRSGSELFVESRIFAHQIPIQPSLLGAK
jgi:hypothetical protein